MSLEWRECRFCLNCAKTYGDGVTKLLRCTHCYVAYYCCKNCQTVDYPKHKLRCHLIKNLWQYAASLRLRYEAFQYPPLPWDEETQYELGTGERVEQWEMVSRTQWDAMAYPKARCGLHWLLFCLFYFAWLFNGIFLFHTALVPFPTYLTFSEHFEKF